MEETTIEKAFKVSRDTEIKAAGRTYTLIASLWILLVVLAAFFFLHDQSNSYDQKLSFSFLVLLMILGLGFIIVLRLLYKNTVRRLWKIYQENIFRETNRYSDDQMRQARQALRKVQ